MNRLVTEADNESEFRYFQFGLPNQSNNEPEFLYF